MKLPRHMELWGPGYVHDRWNRLAYPSKPRRAWLAIADHFEPFWARPTEADAKDRVQRWAIGWPKIAERAGRDSAGNQPCYTFFYPEEEYRPEFLDQLAAMHDLGIADVEIHIHHDGEPRDVFIERMSSFRDTLRLRHGLLRSLEGKTAFGFIHGNWALDNSLPGGHACGLNDEITILRDLGCYADFTMPSGNSPSQARMVNVIYWAKDDPSHPKSYTTGIPVTSGRARDGDLLMIPGPLGLRWADRAVPRMEIGEIAANDAPTRYRVRRWLALAPRIGNDVFIKLHTHGAQEKNSAALLGGDLQRLFTWFGEECRRRQCEFYFVSAWQMYLAIEALRVSKDPVAALAAAEGASATAGLLK
jgi:hypothetical protein